MYLKPSGLTEDEQVVAGFSLRAGGVSSSPFQSLNLGLNAGDNPDDVWANRKKLFESVGFGLDQLAITGQVHGTKLAEVKEPGTFPGHDGMVTRARGVLLCVSAADCASVLLADAKNGVVGACHAGWRGAAGGIVTQTVQAMFTLGADINSLKSYISPCISVENFEVGPEVASQFDPSCITAIPGKEKPHINLKKAIESQLLSAGVLNEHIEVSPYCTFADTKRFFSYRAEKGKTGRHMGFIGLKAVL